MKTKRIISAAAACLLLTGCAANEYDRPSVQYSGLFAPKAASTQVNEVNGKAAAPALEDNTDIESAQSTSSSSNNDRAVSVSRSANAAGNGSDTSDSETAGNGNNSETSNGSSSPNEDTSAEETTPNTGADTSPKKINNPRPASVIYTDAQAVAALQFGDICYFPYKPENKNITADEKNSETEDEDGNKQETKQRPITKYDHGYRVVFRTETDTYLLGILPYGQCAWEDVNDMCRKISEAIEADCQMVGIPSLKDLQYLNDCGIYLPGQYEMWTSTPANPKGNKVYFRNKKGAFYSTKGKLETCGVCAIIRISSPQSDPELLSSSLSNYEEAKARLEAEEEQYKLAISEKQEGDQEQEQE